MFLEDMRKRNNALKVSALLGGKPTSGKPRRVILNTDACNEIDDQMAIIHALLSPELKIEGIIAAHYGIHTHRDSMQRSYNEIHHLLTLLGMQGKVNVLRGASLAMEKPDSPQKSEGAEFIIQCAKSSREPLYIAFLGPLTDMASAYLMSPEVTEKVVVLWIGGGWWPTGGPEFNAFNDWIAADVVFASNLPLVQYPRFTYRMMRVGVAEMERFVLGKGAIGDYLVSLFKTWRIESPIPRAWWVYGDSPAIGTLINPEWGYYLQLPAPRFNPDLSYRQQSTQRQVEVCVEVTAGEIFTDFFQKLEAFSRKFPAL
ncbi:nucleoside hydrolase [Candidatus Aerophobetes bacterium]|nr:nucleoside hydrolase [Candidatus Aerophobetes bacterium]